jgi:single-strand DNA-binding protein
MSGRAKAQAPVETVNEVVLVGRVAAEASGRTLPSGDELVTWRLVVDRPPADSTTGRPVTVDTVDCVAWRPALRRAAGTWAAGDVVRVEGALRRRFWRSPTGAASRYEVEARSVRRLSKA